MDLTKKADTEALRGGHVKEEYIEEDVDVSDFKDQISGSSKSPGGMMSLAMPMPSLPYASPLYPPVFPPGCPPMFPYCPPISAFSLVSLPAPAPPFTAFRDLMENNQNGAEHCKRKPSSKINETNKKLREEPSQGQLVPAQPIREKEKDKSPEEGSGEGVIDFRTHYNFIVCHQSDSYKVFPLREIQVFICLSTMHLRKEPNIKCLVVGRARISCPVCGDTAVAHFHYGGMCCYSCKAFFRRVVNTYKVTLVDLSLCDVTNKISFTSDLAP